MLRGMGAVIRGQKTEEGTWVFKIMHIETFSVILEAIRKGD